MFRIGGKYIDFDLIKSNILIKPTEEIREYQIGREPYSYDVWIYRLDFEAGTSLVDALQQLLSQLYPYRSFISNIATKHDVRIKISAKQCHFTFSSQMLKELSELNIVLEFVT